MSEMLLTAYNGSFLGPIAKVLGWLMNGIYEIMAAVGIENVGLAIILFTIVIYTLMLPLPKCLKKFLKIQRNMHRAEFIL